MIEAMTVKAFKASLLSAMALVLVSATACGKKDSGEAGKVSVKVLTKEPIVILSDYKIPPAEPEGEATTIEGPWFLAVFQLKNDSKTKDVSVAEISFKASTRNQGKAVTGDSSLDLENDQPFFVKVGPGETKDLTLYFSSLPDTDTRIYTMEVLMRGWMSEPATGVPDEVFEGQVFFTTK